MLLTETRAVSLPYCMVRILSWNVRGLNSLLKKHILKCVVLESKVDIVLNQETKMSKEYLEKAMTHIWLGSSWVSKKSHGATRGLAIMWNANKITGTILHSN